MSTRLPRLLGADFEEKRRLHPTALSLSLQLRDTSYAQMTLADMGEDATGEGASFGDSVSIAPGDFAKWSEGHAFMHDGSAPAIVAAGDWDIYRYLLGKKARLRIDGVTENAATQGVYPAGYLNNGQYTPFGSAEAGQVIEAEAIIINCLNTLTATGGSTRQLTPGNFVEWYAGHAFMYDNGAPAVVAAADWDLYRIALGTRVTIRLDAITPNSALQGVYPAAYEINSTYYPMGTGEINKIITCDAILINCRRSQSITGGTAQTLDPATFEAWYLNHAFMGDAGGVPTVMPAEGWDMMRLSLGGKTTVRLDALTKNAEIEGVYPLFYEVDGTYYPLDVDRIGTAFEAEAMLVNARRTTAMEGDAQQTLTPPTGFSEWYTGHAFMGNDAGIPTVAEAAEWDIWRMSLGGRMTVRLDELIRNAATLGVYPMFYELDSTYYPLDLDKVGDVFEADALLVNCKRTESISGETWTPISLTPANFLTIALNNAALMQNGDTMSVAFENGWSIRQWNFDTRRKFKISNAPQTLAGVVTVAYVRDSTYYPIDLQDATKEYEADALVINALTQTTWAGDTQQTLTPSTSWTRLYQNKAFMNGGGGPAFVDAEEWDVYRIALTSGQSIRLDELNKNANIAGVYPAGFEQGGGYYPLDLSEVGQLFQADSIIVNCLRTTTTTGGTWTSLNITNSFTQNVFEGGAVMQNGDQVYVQMAPDWNIMRYALDQRRKIKIASYTANPNTAGTAVVALERDGTYYPINLEDLTTEYEADALVINRRKMTVSSWSGYTYSYTAFSRYRDDTALMNDGSGGVYYQPAENWRVYRRAFDKRTRIKCTRITQNSSLSGVTVAAYEVGGNLYTLSASSTTEIECDAILINCRVGGFPVTLTPPTGFVLYATNKNRFMDITEAGVSQYNTTSEAAPYWDVYTYELGSWQDIRIDSVVYNPQVTGVYAIGAWVGSLQVIKQEDIEAKRVYNANTIKINVIKENTQYAATQITYTPNPNTLYFSATSLSVRVYETSESYAYSATALTISRYDNNGSTVTTRAWSATSLKITPNMREVETTSYSTSGVSGSYSNNDGTPVTTRDYSATSATITPNIHPVTRYAYSMTGAQITKGVTINTNREYSATAMTITANMTPTTQRDFSATNISFSPEATGSAAQDIAMRDWMELFSPKGSAGIFRVTHISKNAKHERTLTLMHAIDTLSDEVWAEQTDYDGYVHYFLSALLDHQETRRWQFGTCQDTSVYKRTGINYTRLSDLLAELLEARPDYYLSFDFSTTPWSLNFLRLPETPDAEFRLTRNVETAQVTRDDSEMCNRLYLSVNTENEGILQTLVSRDFADYRSGYYMGPDGAEIAQTGWNIKRHAFSERTTFRLSALSYSDEVKGVLALAYQVGGTNYPLTDQDAGKTFSADALLINWYDTVSAAALGSVTIATAGEGGTKENTEEIHTYNNLASQALYGTIIKTADIDAANVDSPDAWAQRFLAERSEPAVQITIDGWELGRLTGDSWDEFDRGRLAQVTLSDMGEIVSERVEAVTYPDVIGTPEQITVELANRLAKYSSAIARLQKETRSNGRAARGLARSSASAADQTHLELIVQDLVRAADGVGIKDLWETGIILDAKSGARIYSIYQGLMSNRAEISVNNATWAKMTPSRRPASFSRSKTIGAAYTSTRTIFTSTATRPLNSFSRETAMWIG